MPERVQLFEDTACSLWYHQKEKIIHHEQRGVRTQKALYIATMADLKPDDGSS